MSDFQHKRLLAPAALALLGMVVCSLYASRRGYTPPFPGAAPPRKGPARREEMNTIAGKSQRRSPYGGVVWPLREAQRPHHTPLRGSAAQRPGTI